MQQSKLAFKAIPRPTKKLLPPLPAHVLSSDSESEEEDSTAPRPTHVQPTLSPEQARIANVAINQGKNVFFSGSAGVGKSFLLRHIITGLQKKYGVEQVAVTASTGIAATNIEGCTLHSFAGIGLGQGSVTSLLKKIRKSSFSLKRWSNTRVLIIDEISMIDAELFEKLESIARSVKRNLTQPFGGIQLVLTGDFFQLPPVPDTDENHITFLFESPYFQKCIKGNIFILTQVFRQRDAAFVKILNELRVGNVSEESCRILQSLERVPETWGDSLPCVLHPLRREVEYTNSTRMASLPGETHQFISVDRGSDFNKEKLRKSCVAVDTLQLKVGAQVMLIKNKNDIDLVNGSMGTVVGFDERTGFPQVRFFKFPDTTFTFGREKWTLMMNEVELASRSQIPLILAWAMSIHKSQGQTIDRLKVDLSSIFETGQAYVGLSRAVDMDSLQILNFNPVTIRVSPRVVEFYNGLEGNSK